MDGCDAALKQKTPFRWLWIVPVVFLAVFFFYPLGAILLKAVGNGAAPFSLNWQQILHPFLFTIAQAILSALVTLVIGLPAAFLFVKFSFPGKSILRILTTIPFILPTVVVAAGFNAMLGPRGWLNILLMNLLHIQNPPIHFLNTLAAIILAHVFYNTTIIIRIVGTAWSNLNPRLEHAARSLGASPWRVFFQITLPLLLPSIIAGLLLVFLFDFTSFGVILLLGGPGFSTIETEIYIQTIHFLNLPTAALLSAIQLISTLVTTICIMRFSSQWVVTLTPNFLRSNLQLPTTKKSQAFIFLMTTILLLVFLLPIVSILVRSLVQIEPAVNSLGITETHWTLRFFQELFINRRGSLFYIPPIEAVGNSLIFGLFTMLISLSLGIITAFGLSQKNRLTRWLDPLIMLPLGASAVTLGLGYIIVLSTSRVGQQAYSFLIPIVHSLVAFPFVVRTLQPALASIPESLHQAAATLGAAPLRIMREVDLPIIFRSIVTAGIFSFTISLGEFGATLFLSRPDFPTIPITIYRFLSLPGALNYGQAMAMSAILLILCSLSIFVLELINKQR